MARTQEQIQSMLRRRLIRQHTDSFSFNDLMAVMTKASPEQKERFVDAIKAADSGTVMSMMQTAMNSSVRSSAAAEAQQMLANGSININELDRLL